MPALVIFHVTLGCERFATQLANVWFFLSMDPNMNDKVRSLGKSFVATWMWASERLGTFMQVHVCLQSALSRKAL